MTRLWIMIFIFCFLFQSWFFSNTNYLINFLFFFLISTSPSKPRGDDNRQSPLACNHICLPLIVLFIYNHTIVIRNFQAAGVTITCSRVRLQPFRIVIQIYKKASCSMIVMYVSRARFKLNNKICIFLLI